MGVNATRITSNEKAMQSDNGDQLYKTLLCHAYNYDNIIWLDLGSVGRAVASDYRGPQFKSSHGQNLQCTNLPLVAEKTKMKKKEVVSGPFF